MRKRTILALLALVFVSAVMANPVDPQRAIEVAQQFVPKSTTAQRAPMRGSQSEPSSSIVYTHMMPNSDRPAFYIVNVDGGAFVLVSADDIAHQVLGFSLSSTWPVAKDGSVELPEHIKGFFDDLAAQMETAIEAEPISATGVYKANLRSAAPTRSPSLPDSVGPLLTTTWDQGQYYNSLCPEDANGPGGHAQTGCVATAMAQIIKYWSDPTPGRGTHSYETNYGTLTVDYNNVTYDYEKMPVDLNGTSTQEQVAAVAKLIYHCGVATNMAYGIYESGAVDMDARAGLINFFHFSPNLNFVESAYFTNQEWNNLLRNDIAANRPVMYHSGCENGNSVPHSFVCDGYNGDDFFHFNFGWGGFADGWYMTSAINPSNMVFSTSQAALVNIFPDNTGNVILGQTTGTSTFIVDEPIEFYNIMGNNMYYGCNYINCCNNTVTLLPADEAKQMVIDIMEFKDQNIEIYNGTNTNTLLRSLSGNGENDLSPVLSSANALTLTYLGNMYYPGFKLCISQEDDYRMVSNISSAVETTTVHLTWTENSHATQWQIEYGIKGFDLGNGAVFNTNTNSATFNNLDKLTEYDFYVRSLYDENKYGPWNKVTIMTEAPYWQDIVVKQPEGYGFDETTNSIEIYTAEALAWWSRNPSNTILNLMNDIDLDEYKWKPIPMSAGSILLNGNGHEIKNLHIIEQSDAALFERVEDCTINDLIIRNPDIISGKGRAAVLFKHSAYNNTVKNTAIEGGRIKGTDGVGIFAEETNGSSFINCYTKDVEVEVDSRLGLFVGNGNSDIRNCYAQGKVIMHMNCYNAGIMSFKLGGNIKRCYSIDMVYGVVGSNQGGTVIDTSSIYNNNGVWELRTPITFDNNHCGTLLDALNNDVYTMNDSSLNVWILDEASGLPVFGNKYNVTNKNVTNLVAKNYITETGVEGIIVSWQDNDADKWQIKIIESNQPDDSIKYQNTVSQANDTIVGLVLGKKYDIYVRSCRNEIIGGWGTPVSLQYDKPLWTEVVTEKPDGYDEDENGNITISSSEGLAWLAKILNTNDLQHFSGKKIDLIADIDLSKYRWEPIGDMTYSNGFSGLFDGHNHVISNIYVNTTEGCCGLFGGVENATIRNVILEGGRVKGEFYVGGLIGFCRENCIIDNCHSSVEIFANDAAGSLCGSIYYTVVSNSSSSGNVHGTESVGGLIGHFYGGTITNCYSSSNTYINKSSSTNNWYNGGLIGYFAFSNAYNCYSTGTIEICESSSYIGKVIGCPYYDCHISYVYGNNNNNVGLDIIGTRYCTGIADTAQFLHNLNSNVLSVPATIDNIKYEDLLEALNAWVIQQNNPALKTWILDSNTGLPVFGINYEPSCYNPTNLLLSNASIVGDGTIRTKIEWTQVGSPSYWQILYVDAEHDLSEGVIVNVTSNPCVLADIPIGRPLDFYVRAICENDSSNWSDHVTYIPDKLRWTEVVTTKPEGYFEDENGKVYISSAEGLAWLSSVSNGLNGIEYEMYGPNSLHNKKVFITADIDISLYRWTPLGKDGDHIMQNVSILGNNHNITGLYCNELTDNLGLIGCMSGDISNLHIKNGRVLGEICVGTLVANAPSTNISNCSAEGVVIGIQDIGGLVGAHNNGSIKNCFFNGEISSRSDITRINAIVGYIGGLCGSAHYDTISNCYVVCEVPNNVAYPGIITGSGCFPYSISNCYYKQFETTLQISSSNATTSNNSSFLGNGNNWVLKTPPFVNGLFHTYLIEALNAWVDVNNSSGQYRHWMADTAYVNGGFPIFAPIPGDVNGDGTVDISDYIGVANYILGHAPNGFNETAADVNNDGKIDISDYIGVANIILKGKP